jgi:thiamine biosynthesis protein ThiS
VSTLQTVSIKVNGEPRLVAEGLTVVDLLAELGLRADRVAVEMNRAIIRQPSWGETRIPPDAELEIVQFVGGG